jgi:hypothetical protein
LKLTKVRSIIPFIVQHWYHTLFFSEFSWYSVHILLKTKDVYIRNRFMNMLTLHWKYFSIYRIFNE